VYHGRADPLDEGVGTDAIITDFSKAFDLVPHYRLFTKLATSGVDSKVAVWVREFLVGRTQRVRVGGKLSKEVKVTSGVPQGSVLGPAAASGVRKMILGGTSTRILDSSPKNVSYIEKSQIKKT